MKFGLNRCTVLISAILLLAAAAFAGTVTFSNIDQMSGWQNCGSCAGPNGQGPNPPHSLTEFQHTPSLDGASIKFFLGGTTAFADALWWKQLTPIDTAHFFTYDLYFYFQNAAAPQALEFDVNQSVGGKKFIFGTECDFTGARTWRIWDYYLHWQSTPVSCAGLKPYTWHHLVWEFQRTLDGHTRFIAVSVDGVRHLLNRYYRPGPSGVRELNTAFQMDGNSRMTNYSVWLDKVKLTVW